MRVDISIHIPRIIVALKVFHDSSIQGTQHKNVLLPDSKFSWVLASGCKKGKCNKWTMFKSPLSHLRDYDGKKPSREDRVDYAVSTLDEVVGDGNELFFVREQLRLLLQSRKRYSSDLLIFASCIYYGIAAVYRSSRDSNQLVLPQSSYIRRLSLNVNNKPNIESSHLDYLRKRVSVLSDRERLVNVLSDEILVKNGVSYKGGKITGARKTLRRLLTAFSHSS